jgi:hypothetical protein
MGWTIPSRTVPIIPLSVNSFSPSSYLRFKPGTQYLFYGSLLTTGSITIMSNDQSAVITAACQAYSDIAFGTEASTFMLAFDTIILLYIVLLSLTTIFRVPPALV